MICTAGETELGWCNNGGYDGLAMWHVGRSREVQVGLQYYDLRGRQFGRAKERWKNTNIMFRPAILMFIQNVVKQTAF